MTNEHQDQFILNQHLVIKALPVISTVGNLPTFFPSANLTAAKIRAQIFKAYDRFDSRGRLIAGNGLANSGAIIRRNGTRSVLIDVTLYGNWLSGTGEST